LGFNNVLINKAKKWISKNHPVPTVEGLIVETAYEIAPGEVWWKEYSSPE
jgi:hypothetical protein